MNGGGIADKRGNWFEEHYVLLQALRVLAGDVESLRWERGGEEEDGIDCALREGGVPIESQCKTRSQDQWTLNRLNQAADDRPGFLAYAKAKLESDPTCEVRFVTNARGPDLERLIEVARRVRTADEWANDASISGTVAALVAAWTLSADAVGRERAFNLVRRMEVRVQDKGAMSESIGTLARLLAGADAALLDGELRKHLKATLTRTLHADDIEQAVRAAGVRLEPRANDPRVHERLAALADRFVGRVADVRGLPAIPRADIVARATEWFDSSSGTATAVIHGPAGAGKSEVVATLVTALRGRGVPVLVVQPDQPEASLGLGADAVAALARHAAQRVSVLVVDQLDQVLHAGSSAQRMIADVSGLVRRARALGVRILVGCRSVDAEHETQLNLLLTNATSKPPARIAVSDLTPEQVVDVLTAERTPVERISPTLLNVIRRPLHLALLVALHRSGQDISRLSSATALVDGWWSYVRAPYGADADHVMDTIIERMWSEGRFAVRSDGVDVAILDHLVRSGVLVRETSAGETLLRTSHQLFADVRVAQQWRGAANFAELAALVGDRDRQSLHQARRLRLTVPLIARGLSGPAILNDLMRSASTRPLLKRSTLMALATIDDPSPRLIEFALGWLRSDDPSLRLPTIRVLLWNRPAWVAACAIWIDETWRSSPPAQRDWILRLVGSVSESWGNGAAELLHRWIDEAPEAAQGLVYALGGEPWDDTDALFEIRLTAIRVKNEDVYVNWAKLMSQTPRRAMSMVGVCVRKASAEQLTGHGYPNWAHQLIREKPITENFIGLGRDVWLELRTWWNGFHIEDLTRVQVKWSSLDDSPIIEVVDLMARALAHALTAGQLAWPDLLAELPAELREQDAWLLLRVGHHLGGPPDPTRVAAAEAAAAWFTSDVRWAHVRVGHGSRWDVGIAHDFLGPVSLLLSNGPFSDLENFIGSYEDRWTVDDERFRWDGRLPVWPNTRGATAYLLLPALPASRRSAVADSTLARLGRKFNAYAQAMFRPSLGGGGHVRSVVPLDVAKRWSGAEWKKRLTSAPAHGAWRQTGEDAIETYDFGTLCDLVSQVAQQQPREFFVVAVTFDDEVPGAARAAALRGLTLRAGRPAEAPKPLDDASVIAIVLLPHYLDSPDCVRELVWLVEERSGVDWPDVVIARIEQIAAGVGDPGVRLEDMLDRDHGLAAYRLSDPACRSLDVLGRIAHGRQALRARVLALADSLRDHPDIGRRASAGHAAACVYEEDKARAGALIIEVARDPDVAAEQDIWQGVAWLAGRGVEWPAVAAGARSALLALPRQPREGVAKVGGEAVLLLRARGELSDAEVRDALRDAPVARSAAAALLARWLGDPENEWDGCRDLAVEWANDAEASIGDTIVSSLRGARAQLLVEDRGFIARLVESRAGARNVDDVLEFYDRSNQLSSVAASICTLATRVANGDDIGVQAWQRETHAKALCARLARLLEESERRQDWDMRTRALDAWDQLLLTEGVPAAERELAAHLEPA